MEKPVAAFDVDGSLYRSNLSIGLLSQLVRQGSFPEKALFECSQAQREWELVRHRASFTQYSNQIIETYGRHIKGVPVADLQAAANEVVKHSPRKMYMYGRKLVEGL